MIAVACGCQFLDGIAHGDERRDLGVDLGDMVQRQALDVGAGPPFVVPEIEKPPYALDREAEIAGAADEAQNADIGLAVNAVAAFAAAGGRDQAGDFVIADGLGRHAGTFGRLPDIHGGASMRRTPPRMTPCRQDGPSREGKVKLAIVYRRVARVPTVSGARTSLFVPELDRLFVAARAGSNEPAGCTGRTHEVGWSRRGIGCGADKLWRGRAYRPFDGTDAAVVEPGEIEIELGPVEYLRQGAERALLAPDLRINYGFIAGWEVALEGKLAHGLTAGIPGRSLVESQVLLKVVLREGTLQEKPGPVSQPNSAFYCRGLMINTAPEQSPTASSRSATDQKADITQHLAERLYASTAGRLTAASTMLLRYGLWLISQRPEEAEPPCHHR
jgi:hypothetical protein